MLPLGTQAPNFHIRDVVSNNYYSLDDLKSDKATVIMFICNHCPFVIHVNSELVKMANEYSCLLYTSPSPRDRTRSRMPSSA